MSKTFRLAEFFCGPDLEINFTCWDLYQNGEYLE